MAAAKALDGKKIADQLEQKQSEVLKSLFGITRQSKKNNKNTAGMPCICGKNGNIKVSLEDYTELWKMYEKMLNGKNGVES